MRKITLSEYNAIPENYRGIWTVERWDLPDWAEIRKRHIGKRTMMVYDKGTCLLVEGIGFEIVDDSGWKKPDEIRKDIDMLYQEFCNMRKCEPHYADCIIRWQDTLDTLETRIALSMDPDTEWDEEIFYYCNSRNELKSLTEKGCSDFVIADSSASECMKSRCRKSEHIEKSNEIPIKTRNLSHNDRDFFSSFL